MSGLVIDDGVKESDYGYVLRVSGPRECAYVVNNLRGSKGRRADDAWLLRAEGRKKAQRSLTTVQSVVAPGFCGVDGLLPKRRRA